MQVKELNQSILGLPDWMQFLRRSSVIIAALLLGSALIMAVAANWLSWPKVGRIALLQFTITALVILAWRLGKRKPKDWARAYSLSSLSINLAAIAIGGLLALIGQSYQTGADPWQLFALWAVLLLPWLFVLRSLFIILLVLTLTNLALYLFFGLNPQRGIDNLVFSSFYDSATWVLVLFNGLVLYLSQQCRAFFTDPYLVIRRFALISLMSSMWWWQWQLWSLDLVGAGLINLVLIAVTAALAWYYLRRQSDVITGALAYMGLYALVLLFMLLTMLNTSFSFVLLSLVSTFLGGFLIFDLRNVWNQLPRHTMESTSTEPWFLRLFYLAIQFLAMGLFLLMWWMVFGRLNEITAHAYVLFSVIAIGYLQRKSHGVLQKDVPLFLFLTSMMLAATGLGLSHDDSLTTMWFLFLSSVVYFFSNKVWLLRFCSGMLSTFLLFWLAFDWFYVREEIEVFIEIVTIVLLLAVVTLAALMHKRPAYEWFLAPLWWAWVVTLIGFLGWNYLDAEISFSTVHLVNLTVSLLVPVCLFFLLLPRYSVVFSLACGAAAAVLTVGWLMPAALANLALLGWIWAYAKCDKVLFWSAALLLFSALGQLYYSLPWPLWEKAVALAAGGAWLAFGAALLHRAIRRATSKTEAAVSTIKSSSGFVSPYLYPSLFGGLALVLAISAQDVGRKEHLLSTGVPVVLELAPVDPRSLMQGDYMALRFAVVNQLIAIDRANSDLKLLEAMKITVYMKPSTTMGSALVALQNPLDKQVYWVGSDGLALSTSKPTELDLADLASVRWQRTKGQWTPNGVDAWFFPEGQARHFEKARYGEFKTNAKGDVLLHGLLDAKAQPMAAPVEEMITGDLVR